MELTAVCVTFPEGYAAFVEQPPGADAQGETLDEARTNLAEAVQLVLEADRQMAEESVAGEQVIREPLAMPEP